MIIFLLGSSHGGLRSQVESFSSQDIYLVQCWLDSENLGSPLSVSDFQGVLDSRWRHFRESLFLPTEMFVPILNYEFRARACVRATPHLKFAEILLMHCLLWIFRHISLVVNFSLLLFLQWTDVYIWPEQLCRWCSLGTLRFNGVCGLHYWWPGKSLVPKWERAAHSPIGLQNFEVQRFNYYASSIYITFLSLLL